MPGWAYFVREDEFQAHIANHVDEPEVFLYIQRLKTTMLRQDVD
jgi:hypothetical protein